MGLIELIHVKNRQSTEIFEKDITVYKSLRFFKFDT